MEDTDIIRKRRSIRNFDSQKEVTDKQVERLLDAARWAPSAGNKQAWFFVVVRELEVKKQLVKAARDQEFITEAPVAIVPCADTKESMVRYGERGRDLYSIQDATLAGYNLWLEAVGMGLGSVWVGGFDESLVSQILKLPEGMRPVAILPIGYATEAPEPKARKEINAISKKM